MLWCRNRLHNAAAVTLDEGYLFRKAGLNIWILHLFQFIQVSILIEPL